MASLNSAIEAGLKATNVALNASSKAKREMEIAVERNAARAESEGMRAEEVLTRYYLSSMTFTQQVCSYTEGLRKPCHRCRAELV